MAELVKPQYHEKSKYPSGRTRVYDVRPAQEQYRGSDENAGIVDLSTSKIFDAVQEGAGIQLGGRGREGRRRGGMGGGGRKVAAGGEGEERMALVILYL